MLHTDLETIPAWAGGLTSLEYLHIEGKQTSTGSLTALPTALFARMSALTYLHLGGHAQLAALPPLEGLVRLRTLVLARAPALAHLPDVPPRLRTLSLVQTTGATALPNLAVQHNLAYLGLGPSFAPLCCNGFLTQGVREPASTGATAYCAALGAASSSATATPATLALVTTTFRAAISCFGAPAIVEDDPSPTQASVAVCAGFKYRRCSLTARNGSVVPGVCVGVRFQVVSCTPDLQYARFRTLQIQRQLGDPCDPVEEAWLGCSGRLN